jgi:hypothetical protein
MRALLFLTILAVSCFADQYDSGDFDQDSIIGVWMKVTERPAYLGNGVPLYYKDTIHYRIGYDKDIVPDTVAHYKHPISFVIVERLGSPYYGYLFDPRDQDFDQNAAPIITYSWVGLVRPYLTAITLTRHSIDSLTVTHGNETFGLRKAR